MEGLVAKARNGTSCAKVPWADMLTWGNDGTWWASPGTVHSYVGSAEAGMEHPGGRNYQKCKDLWGMGRHGLGASASQAAADLGPWPPTAHPVIQAVVWLPGLTVLTSPPTTVTCFLENINLGSLTPSPQSLGNA